MAQSDFYSRRKHTPWKTKSTWDNDTFLNNFSLRSFPVLGTGFKIPSSRKPKVGHTFGYCRSSSQPLQQLPSKSRPLWMKWPKTLNPLVQVKHKKLALELDSSIEEITASNSDSINCVARFTCSYLCHTKKIQVNDPQYFTPGPSISIPSLDAFASSALQNI